MEKNHDYTVPKPGATDWHVPINDNFERLDRDVEIRDSEDRLGEYAPKEGAKFFATDTGATYCGDGSTWNGPLPVTTTENRIGRTKHFSEGSDLGRQIAQAIDEGYRALHVHAKADGSEWTWDTDVVYDTVESGKLEIVCYDHATIDYTGSVRPLTITGSGDGDGTQAHAFRLVGGDWCASGSPTQWLRVDDQVGFRINPREVDYRNTGATCLEIRNDAVYSELGVVEGLYRGGNGIDFVPASVTGGSGTDSFQSNTIRDVNVEPELDGGFGVRMRGNFRYSEIRRLDASVRGDGGAALVVGSHDTLGTVISGMGVEASGGASDVVGVRTTSSYDNYYAPLFVGYQPGGVDRTDLHDEGHDFPTVRSEAGKLRLGTLSYESTVVIDPQHDKVTAKDLTVTGSARIDEHSSNLRFAGGGDHDIGVEDDGCVEYRDGRYFSAVPCDVLGAIETPEEGMMSYHDGARGNTTGPCYHDGSSWRSLVDGTTIN